MMPTVFRFGASRVVIYPNDHRPPHVHVMRNGLEAVFQLCCPDGPVELRQNYGFPAAIWPRLPLNSTRIWKSFAMPGREFMDFEAVVEQATERAEALQSALPKAISARYDRRVGRVVIRLESKLEIAFSPRDAEGLENAHPDQLEPIEISPSGFGIHFPTLDADIYLPALVEGFLGSKKWMAARMGESGGKSRSEAKTAAARRNGTLGCRPRKSSAA